jgi:chemotaxis protein methyltransferase CheR
VSGWSHPAFEHVVSVVGAHTGLSVAAGRASDAETRIRRAMARANVTDVSHYLTLIQANAVPLDDLVMELAVGETYFFREPRHFDFIRREVLPDVRRRRGPDHAVRIWSAGCSTGEEAYSLAITLEDAHVAGHVLATDLSRAALRSAREATYRRWSLRGLDEALIRRCFHERNGRWALDPRYHGRVTFQFHNLVQDASPSVPAGISGMDLILCRNVLIYLNRESVARVVRGLSDALVPGGWLITGPSDPLLNDIASFRPVITDGGVFYRKVEGRDEVTDGRAAADTTPVDSRPSEAVARPVLAVPTTSSADGDAQGVRQPMSANDDDEATAARRVRAIANADGTEPALRELARQLQRHPLSTELHLLRALLHFDLKRDVEAVDALRRVLYLDRSLVVANFLLASALRGQRRFDDARRAYRNARDLAQARPPDEPIPLGDGMRAGRIVETANAELARLDRRLKRPS